MVGNEALETMPLLFRQSLGEVASGSVKIRNWSPRLQVRSVTATRNCCLVSQLQSNKDVVYVISYSVIYTRNIMRKVYFLCNISTREQEIKLM
jgi:hypothetical protein